MVINQTRISSAKIRRIIRFVLPKGTKWPEITITNCEKWTFEGTFWPKEREALLEIADYKTFPLQVLVNEEDKKKGYLSGFWLRNKEEALVYLLAHELRHAWQQQYPDAPRKGKRKNKYSESDADLYAIYKLNMWRKLKERYSQVPKNRFIGV